MLSDFLKALFSQAWSLGSGTAVGLSLLVWERFAGGDIPGWGYGVVLIGMFLGASFQAWRQEHLLVDATRTEIAEIRDSRPHAVLKLVVRGKFLCVEVRNEGAQGSFRGFVETEPDEENRRLFPTNALWLQSGTDAPVEIGRRMAAALKIATEFEDRSTHYDDRGVEYLPHYGWKLLHADAAAGRDWFEGNEFLHNEDPNLPWFTARITVLSTPEMQGGLAIKRIRFVGRDAIDIDSNERYRPDLIITHEHEEEPPY